MSEIGDGIRPLPPIDRQKSEEEKNSDKGAIKSCISNSRVWVVNAVLYVTKDVRGDSRPGSEKEAIWSLPPLHLLFPFSNTGGGQSSGRKASWGEEKKGGRGCFNLRDSSRTCVVENGHNYGAKKV